MTRGQLEDEIGRRMMAFEKEHVGRGPESVRVYAFSDIVFVRLGGVLTRGERRLSAEPDGARVVKELRLRLTESSRSELRQLVEETTGCGLVSLHTDLSTRTGEQVVVFTLDRSLEAGWERGR